MDTKELAVVEYSEERVLTTEQVAEFYECNADNIKINFNANRERFVEGKHYFKVEGEALSKLRVSETNLQISPMTRSLYLWTKRGCARHAKMLKTDRAWEVFEELEENYFTTKKSTVQTSRPLKVSDIAQDVVSAAKIFEEYLGLKQGIAFVHSVALAEGNYNINLEPIKKLAPPAEHDTGYMNATQLGEKVGKSARTTNKWLADNGYQFKDGKDWRLTEKGKQYAEELPYTSNGHSGYQIRWASQIVTFLLEDSIQ